MVRGQRVVILGGGYAGLFAAARLAPVAASAAITLVDGRAEFTQRVRMHELLAGRSVASVPYRELLEPRGIAFRQARVERVDPDRRRVELADHGGGRQELPYDILIIALGSVTGAPIPGAAEHAIRLNDPEEVRHAAARIADVAARQGRLLVVGGGLTGIESATELAERHAGLRVTLATRGRLDADYSAEGGAHIRATLERLGIELVEHADVSRLEEGRACLGDGTLPFDLAIWTGGFLPSPLGRRSGLPVDAAGGILVDDRLQVIGHPEILVAGDSASCDASWGHLRMGCVTASPMGAHAGENARRIVTGEAPEPFDFSFAIRCISLGRRNALVQGTSFDDRPIDRIYTGRIATIVKELICQGVYRVPQWELKTGLRILPVPHVKKRADIDRVKIQRGVEWKPMA
jgi:NADH dehydrogenase FAD-containing subunit